MKQEEKAKAYDEVLKKARMFYKDEHVDNEVNSLLEVLFPELKESDSEDERIRKCLIDLVNGIDTPRFYGIDRKAAIVWLEKKGEQKPQGKTALEAINEEKIDNANKVESKQEKLTKFERAVKQVMEEAIECGDTRNLKADAEMLLSLVHKSAWSEEDEKTLERVIRCIENHGYMNVDDVHWLKSFKDRVQSQPKQEWSEEDKNRFTNLIHLIKCSKENNATKAGFIEFINKLKFLRPQSTWKPSDEYINALEYFIRSLGESGYSSSYDNKMELLRLLLFDLKKLKE